MNKRRPYAPGTIVQRHKSAADLRLEAALADGTIRLLSCDWLRAQPTGFVSPRHQDLPPAALLTPDAAASAFSEGDRRVGVLSYGWLTRAHPDPGGERAVHVLAYLRSPDGMRFESLFWDFACVPEPDAKGYISDTDLARQQKAFTLMNALYASATGTAVIRLSFMPSPQASLAYNLRPIDERGWCVFEMYVAMIVVGTDPAQGSMSRACARTPKLLDATGGAVPELVEAPTPKEFEERLDRATFTVAADVARAKKMYLEYYLENGVGRRARLALVEYQRGGRRRRRRILVRVICAALPAIGIGMALDKLQVDGELIGKMLYVTGMAVCIFAAQPDEGKVTRFMGRIAIIVVTGVAAGSAWTMVDSLHELLTPSRRLFINGTLVNDLNVRLPQPTGRTRRRHVNQRLRGECRIGCNTSGGAKPRSELGPTDLWPETRLAIQRYVGRDFELFGYTP